ncbi:hypothetical protein HDU98_002832 [Podochytrium sp. JEL0797]|nr:hypothetical protein HDU98_002832 [Podochytrium sp. JEL0797]
MFVSPTAPLPMAHHDKNSIALLVEDLDAAQETEPDASREAGDNARDTSREIARETSAEPADDFDRALRDSFGEQLAAAEAPRLNSDTPRPVAEEASRKRKADSDNADSPQTYNNNSSSSKKISKRSRTLFSKSRRRRRKRALDEEHLDTEEVTYGTEVLEDPSKLYCYCQEVYNENLFYIQCDECNQWFCSNCTFLQESQLDSIILFYCIPCETTTGKKTFRRRLCAAYEYTQKLEIEMEDEDDPESSTAPSSSTATPAPAADASSSSPPRQRPKPLPYTHPTTCKTHVPHASDTHHPSPAQSDSSHMQQPLQPRVLESSHPMYYCSETCGLSLARHRLITSITAPRSATTRLPSKLTTRRRDISARVEMDRKIHEVDPRLPVSAPIPPPSGPPTLSRLEATDLTALRRMQLASGEMKTRMRALQVWLDRVEGALERCEVRNVGKKGVESVCGFDERMVGEWVVPSWKEWGGILGGERRRLLREKEEEEEEGEEGEVVEEKMGGVVEDVEADETKVCFVKGKCSHHVGWKILRVVEVETEMNLAMQDLEKNNQAMQRIIDGIRKRREDARGVGVERPHSKGNSGLGG